MVRYENFLLACLLGSATAVKQSQHSDDGRLHCGIFGSGAETTAHKMYSQMRFENLKDKTFTIKPGRCDRVHCHDTTGVYVCNVRTSHGLLSSSLLYSRLHAAYSPGLSFLSSPFLFYFPWPRTVREKGFQEEG